MRSRIRDWAQVKRQLSDAVFDGLTGMDTAAPLSHDALGFHPCSGNEYWPSGLGLWRVIRRLGVTDRDVFYDCGAGKGRALAIAATFPFKRVAGIELSPTVADLCRTNLRRRRLGRRCREVAVGIGDATTSALPDDVTVLYLFNPFEGPVFGALVDRVLESLARRPRRLRVVYTNAVMRDALVAHEFLPTMTMGDIEVFERAGPVPPPLRHLRAATARRAVQAAAVRSLGSVAGARTDDPVIAITFDDGPHPEQTPKVLELLARHNAKATFFVSGGPATANPGLLERVVAGGHEVGWHGSRHIRLTGLGIRAQLEVIGGSPDQVRSARNGPRWFRPPYGSQSIRSYLLARARGFEVVVWSAAADEWLRLPVPDHVERATADLGPGGVLLLHDRFERGVDGEALLEGVLAHVGERGWRCVTLSELLHGRVAERMLWFAD